MNTMTINARLLNLQLGNQHLHLSWFFNVL